MLAGLSTAMDEYREGILMDLIIVALMVFAVAVGLLCAYWEVQ